MRNIVGERSSTQWGRITPEYVQAPPTGGDVFYLKGFGLEKVVHALLFCLEVLFIVLVRALFDR